ncbi:MAG: hypothetical protein ACE5DI_02995 [Candidatus Micrarchaeia archaeon]
MVSIYTKAAVITVILFAANFMFIKVLDDNRANEIITQLEEVELQSHSSRLLFQYLQTIKAEPENACPALEQKTKEQATKTYQAFAKLQTAKAENIVSGTDPLDKKYLLANSELLLDVYNLQKLCDSNFIEPILYFYPHGKCIECQAQAEVLEQVKAECQNARVFAFPLSSDLGFLEVIKKQQDVTQAPSLVINDKTFKGLTSKNDALKHLKCQ